MASVDSLVDYLKIEAGEMLRAVGVYQDGRTRLVYHRDDLDRDGLRRRQRTIVENLDPAQRSPDAEAPLDEVLGQSLASLQVRQEAVIVHLPLDGRGVLVGLEPEAARNLTTFTVECLRHLRELPSAD